MIEDVLVYLDQYYPLTQEIKVRLSSILRSATVKKKEYLLKEGEVCNNIYFIEKGLVRVYYVRDGLEICSGLLHEGGVVIAVDSFFNRNKSHEYIQAIEETTVHYITHHDLDALYRDFIEFNVIGRKLITEYYVRSEERNYWLRKQSVSEKYDFFLNRFGAAASRLPRKDIASYLGITLETLSRLRNQ